MTKLGSGAYGKVQNRLLIDYISDLAWHSISHVVNERQPPELNLRDKQASEGSSSLSDYFD